MAELQNGEGLLMLVMAQPCWSPDVVTLTRVVCSSSHMWRNRHGMKAVNFTFSKEEHGELSLIAEFRPTWLRRHDATVYGEVCVTVISQLLSCFKTIHFREIKATMPLDSDILSRLTFKKSFTVDRLRICYQSTDTKGVSHRFVRVKNIKDVYFPESMATLYSPIVNHHNITSFLGADGVQVTLETVLAPMPEERASFMDMVGHSHVRMESILIWRPPYLEPMFSHIEYYMSIMEEVNSRCTYGVRFETSCPNLYQASWALFDASYREMW